MHNCLLPMAVREFCQKSWLAEGQEDDSRQPRLALTWRGHGRLEFLENVIEGRAPHVVRLPDLPTFSPVVAGGTRRSRRARAALPVSGSSAPSVSGRCAEVGLIRSCLPGGDLLVTHVGVEDLPPIHEVLVRVLLARSGQGLPGLVKLNVPRLGRPYEVHDLHVMAETEIRVAPDEGLGTSELADGVLLFVSWQVGVGGCSTHVVEER